MNTLNEAEKFGIKKYGEGNFIVEHTAYGYKVKKNDRTALTKIERELVHKLEKEQNMEFTKVIKDNDIRYYIFRDENKNIVEYCLVLVRQE